MKNVAERRLLKRLYRVSEKGSWMCNRRGASAGPQKPRSVNNSRMLSSKWRNHKEKNGPPDLSVCSQRTM